MHSFKITYAVHTNSCTFLLDAEGICRRIVPNPTLSRTPKGREAAAAANRCVGAQYVASLDNSLPGMLAEMPRVGIPMIFARVDERGRVSLVRTGVVTQFDSEHRDHPFPEHAPSVSVETSAPAIPPPSSKVPHNRFRSARAIAMQEDDVDLGAPTVRRPMQKPAAAAVARTAPTAPLSEPYLARPRERTRTAEPARAPQAAALYPAAESHVGRRSGGR